MRDYLKMFEIEQVLRGSDLNKEDIAILMTEMEIEAETCLCFAKDSSECVCGAIKEDDDYDE